MDNRQRFYGFTPTLRGEDFPMGRRHARQHVAGGKSQARAAQPRPPLDAARALHTEKPAARQDAASPDESRDD